MSDNIHAAFLFNSTCSNLMSPVVFTELSNFEPSRQMGAKPCYPSCCHFGKIQGLNQLGRNLQKLDKQRLASSMAFCQCAITPIAQKDDEASCIGPCCRPSNLGTVTWEVTNPICIRQMNSIEHHKPDPFGCPNFDKSTLRFIFAHLSYVSLGSPIPNQTSLTMELQCIILSRWIQTLPAKRSLAVPRISQYRLHPCHSERIGEADNPRPSGKKMRHRNVTCVVTNPTCIYNKSTDLAELAADVLILSETAATKAVQAIETQKLRAKGYQSIWGHPVPPQLHTATEESLRGAAAGVSIHSRFPCRSSAHEDTTDWFYSGRCQHAFIQFPTLEVQICNLYGFPASTGFAKGRTNSLLEHVIQRSRFTTHATMICGDFNHHPDHLEAMQVLRHLGFRTAEEIYMELKGQCLPPTYGTSTRHDVCILSPSLTNLVTDVWVDDSKMLAGHNPLCVELQLPATELYVQN